MYMSTVDTPAGPFTMLVDRDGAVLASGWTDGPDALLPQVHKSLRGEIEARADAGAATTAVLDYLAGDLTAPDRIEVRQVSSGTFLSHAWDELRRVKPGQPISYTEFAARAGRPAATRAAAQACARNAVALFVPCHRVLRNDGSLGGFRWGLDVKRWLLTHEE